MPNPRNLPHLQTLTHREAWLDIGAHATWFGADIDSEGTCLAPGSKGLTRRDYIIANPAARPYITGFHIVHKDTYLATHSILQLKLTPTNTGTTHLTTTKVLPSPHTLFTTS